MFWQDTTRNLLIYGVDETMARRILSVVPGSRYLESRLVQQIPVNLVAFPITLQNIQIAAWLKLPVPPPMVTYDYPFNPQLVAAPFASQIDTSNFLVANPHSLCLSDPGTGKTLSSLWAADFLMCNSDFAFRPRCLIAAPLTALERTWGNEIAQHFMGRRTFTILHGSPRQREMLLSHPSDFYIINHDGLKIGIRRRKREFEITGLAEILVQRADIQIIILDEIGHFRDGGTDRHRAGRVACFQRRYVWGLTGTPTPNAPSDAHGIVRLVKPDLLETFTSFKNRTMIRVNQHKWVARPGAKDAAFALMQPCIRYRFEECVDIPEMLPPITYDVLMTEPQKKWWRELRTNLLLQLKNGAQISIPNQASLRSKLMQISAGEVYDEKHKAHAVDCSTRLAALFEAIEEAGAHKVIVSAPLTSVVHMLEKEIGKRWSVTVINGPVPRKERDKRIKAFQTRPDPHVMVVDPTAMSQSLNLAVASTVIHYVPPDKPEAYQQLNMRIRRPDQRNQQRIVHLASNKYEREVFRRQWEKIDLQDVILQLVEEQ